MSDGNNKFLGVEKNKELMIYENNTDNKTDIKDEIELPYCIKEIVDNIINFDKAANSYSCLEGLELVNKLLKLHPNKIELLNIKGNFLKQMGKFQEALDCYLDCFELGKNSSGFFVKIADILLKLGEFDKGIKLCNYGLIKFPNNLALCELKSDFNHHKLNFSDSLDGINKCLDKNKKSNNLLFKKALNLYNLKLFDFSLEVIDNVLDNDDKNGEYWYLKGLILREQGDEKYIYLLRKALRLGNLKPNIYKEIGDIFLNDSYYEGSTLAYKKYIGIKYNNYEVYNRLGKIHELFGRYKEASNYYETSLNLKTKQILNITRGYSDYIFSHNTSIDNSFINNNYFRIINFKYE